MQKIKSGRLSGRWRGKTTLFALSAFFVYLRFHKLFNKPFWYDEIIAAYAIRISDSFLEVFKNLKETTSHPPFFWFLGLIFEKPFKFFNHVPSDEMLRILPFSFGVLSIFFFWRLLKNFSDPFYRLIAFSLFGLNALAIYYAQEYRQYSLLLLLSIISLDYFLRIFVKKKYKLINFMLFIATTSLLIYTHYFGIFLIATLGTISLPLSWKDKQSLKVSVLIWLVIFFLVLPGMLDLWAALKIASGIGFAKYFSHWQFLNFFKLILNYCFLGIHTNYGKISYYFFLTLFILGIVNQPRDETLSAVKAIIFAQLIFTFLATMDKPAHTARYNITFVPAAVLIFASGVSYIYHRLKATSYAWLVYAVIIAVLFLNFKYLRMNYVPNKEDWRSTVGYLNQIVSENDVVYIGEPWLWSPLAYYNYKYYPKYLSYTCDKDLLESKNYENCYFIAGGTGADHRIGFHKKLKLIKTFKYKKIYKLTKNLN